MTISKSPVVAVLLRGRLVEFYLSYWSQHFKITNADFFKRIVYSLVFFRPVLVNEIRDRPDLYGPFWIYSTLILLLATSGNISSYWKSGDYKGTVATSSVIYCCYS